MMTMPVMVVMMVVVMPRMTAVLYVAVCLVTMLALCFKLNGDVIYSMFGKLLADLVLDVVRLFVCNRMERCIIELTVKTPKMNVVNVDNTVYLGNMLLYFRNAYSVGGLFKEKIKRSLEIFDRVHYNK